MMSQFKFYIQKSLKFVSLLFISLFFTGTLWGQKISVEVDPGTKTLNYGESLVISRLSIKETDMAGFGKAIDNTDYDTIKLENNFSGYKFYACDSIVGHGNDIDIQPQKIGGIEDDSIKVTFRMKAKSESYDEIVFYGLTLAAKKGEDNYEGSIKVLVDTNDHKKDSYALNTSIGNYQMASEPKLVFSYPSDTKPCLGSPYSFEVGFEDSGELGVKDSITVTYRNNNGNDSVLVDKQTLTSLPIPVSIESLDEDFDSVIVQVKYASGWSAYASIGFEISDECSLVEVDINPPSDMVGFGDTLTIQSIAVKENYRAGFCLNAFGVYNTITIFNDIEGYELFKIEKFTTYGGDLNSTILGKVIESDRATITFNSADEKTIDTIGITNLKLVPKLESSGYSYSGDLQVLVNNYGSDKHVADETSGTYTMVKPLLDLTYEDAICGNSQFTLNVKVIDAVTSYNKNDTLFIEYLKDKYNYSDSIIKSYSLSSITGKGEEEYEFVLDSLLSGYNFIRVKLLRGHGWEVSDTLTIGNNATYDIYRKETPQLNFKGDAANGEINVSVLLGDLDLLELLDFENDLELDIDTTVDYIDTNYVFHPNIAGKGEKDIPITLTSPSGCSISDTLIINVIPDIITLDPVYCYDPEYLNKDADTVEVAFLALKEAYKTDDSCTISFNSLDVVYAGEKIDSLTTQKTDSIDFLRFPIYPSKYIEDALNGNVTKDVDLIFRLNIKVVTTITETLYLRIEASSRDELIAEDWNCGNKYNGSYCDCYKTITKQSTAYVNIESELTTVAIPKDDGYLVGFDTGYCQNSDSVMLTPIYSTDSIVGQGIINKDDDFYFKPDTFLENKHTETKVKYFYKDNNGCLGDNTYNVNVYPVPQVEFDADPICENDTQLFRQYSPDSKIVNIVGWDWDFGDGFDESNINEPSETNIDSTMSTWGEYRSPYHVYSYPGEKRIVLGVMSDAGCINYDTATIVVGKKPTPIFSYTGKLQEGTTTLYNESEFEDYDPVENYIYHITSPSGKLEEKPLTTKDDVPFIPTEFGVYNVELQTISGNGCESTTDTLIPVFPVVKVTNDKLYSEDFQSEDSQEGWLSSDQYYNRLESSWAHVPVSGVFNDGNHHQDGHMWLVGAPSDSSIDDETSWLESPCFDLSELNFPMVSLDLMQSLEVGRDGAALYYTLDDGENWERLGEMGEIGQNWYNASGIFSKPGVDEVTSSENEGSQGWSKDTTGWVSARYPIDSLAKASAESPTGCLRFRIAYNSNNYHNIEQAGLGVDNFLVGKRKRIVLLEQFINSGYEIANPSDYRYDSTDLNDFVDKYPEEVVDIRYHSTSSSRQDELCNVFNTQKDNNGRASAYYATSCGSLWVMDGMAVANKVYCVNQNISYEQGYKKRGLVDPAFDIYNVSVDNLGGELKIKATIKKISSHIDEKIGEHKHNVRMAIVQKEYTGKDGQVYRNLLVDLLPTGDDGDAVAVLRDFAVGDSIEVSESWVPLSKTVGNNYRLIIYVQGRSNYDEVEQVWFRDLETAEVPQTENTNGFSGLSTIANGKMEVYPNPASEVLNVRIPDGSSLNATWSVYSISGQEVMGGKTTFEGESTSLDVSSLNEGLYILRLNDNNDWQYSCKFSILKN